MGPYMFTKKGKVVVLLSAYIIMHLQVDGYSFIRLSGSNKW